MTSQPSGAASSSRGLGGPSRVEPGREPAHRGPARRGQGRQRGRAGRCGSGVVVGGHRWRWRLARGVRDAASDGGAVERCGPAGTRPASPRCAGSAGPDQAPRSLVHASTQSSWSLQVVAASSSAQSACGVPSTRPCRSRPRRSACVCSQWPGDSFSATVARLRARRRLAEPHRRLAVGLGRHHVVHPHEHAVRVLRLGRDHPGVGPARGALVGEDALDRLACRRRAGSPGTARSSRRRRRPP